MNTKRLIRAIASLAIAACATTATADPVPGSFTYQGVLEEVGAPVNVNSDFLVRLYDGATFITQVNRLDQPVTDGQFQLDLDFSPALFDGTNYDLEILVRSPAGVGFFEVLNPRQPLATTPYAFHANTADTLLIPATIEGSDPGHLLSLTQTDAAAPDSVALRATRGPATNASGFIPSVVEVESDGTAIGVLALANQFPIAGILSPDSAGFNNSAAVLGQIQSGGPGGQAALWALNQTSGNNALLGTDDFAADLAGDLRVAGNITKDFSPGSFDLATPIAYGFVNSTGIIANGTPNFSATWNAGLLRYEIEIDNEAYFFTEYVTIVTPTFQGVSTRTGSSGGRLIVTAERTTDQASVQSNFQFVTYKTAGAALIQGQERPPLIPLNTLYTDEQLTPRLAPPTPRIPIIIEPTTKSPIERD